MCSLTGTLQRKFELEYSTPNEGYANERIMQASPKKEPAIPHFPLLEEKKNKGKRKEKAETSRQEDPKYKFQETGLPDPLPPSSDVRRQIGQEGIKICASNYVGETSGNDLSIAEGKPLPYRPPPFVNKGG